MSDERELRKREELELRAQVKRLEAGAPARRGKPALSNYEGARQAGEVATLKHEREQLKAKLKELTT